MKKAQRKRSLALRPKRALVRIGHTGRLFWSVARKEKIPVMILIFAMLLCAGSIGFYFCEGRAAHLTYLDCAWWAIVTMATVGYGDIAPKTLSGRAIAVALMLSGMVVLSIITAIIASILVEKKLREVRGLDSITLRDHIVVCGWNEYVDDVLRGILTYAEGPVEAILINEMDEETISALKFKYRDAMSLMFVKGDFTQELVLERASVGKAASVIILSDASGGKTLEHADERVILGTLAVKHMAPGARVCAELMNRKNEPHLKRAHADDIVVRGRHSGFFLSSSAITPGIPLVMAELLNYELGARLEKKEIPLRFVGKTFRELAYFIRESTGAIVVGILSRSCEIGLSEILSDDMSDIDRFIKQKFEEAGSDLFLYTGGYKINLSPKEKYIVEANDEAVVITPVQEKQEC